MSSQASKTPASNAPATEMLVSDALELVIELADWANIRKYSDTAEYAKQNHAIEIVRGILQDGRWE